MLSQFSDFIRPVLQDLWLRIDLALYLAQELFLELICQIFHSVVVTLWVVDDLYAWFFLSWECWARLRRQVLLDGIRLAWFERLLLRWWWNRRMKTLLRWADWYLAWWLGWAAEHRWLFSFHQCLLTFFLPVHGWPAVCKLLEFLGVFEHHWLARLQRILLKRAFERVFPGRVFQKRPWHIRCTSRSLNGALFFTIRWNV